MSMYLWRTANQQEEKKRSDSGHISTKMGCNPAVTGQAFSCKGHLHSETTAILWASNVAILHLEIQHLETNPPQKVLNWSNELDGNVAA